jgi:hypothetical protein
VIVLGWEPVTMLTDYGLGVVAVLLAWRLIRANDSRAARLWALAFAVTGVAAVVGGSVHGFAPLMPTGLMQGLRTFTVMAVGLASACLLAGVVFAAAAPGTGRLVLLGVCALKLGLYLAWVVPHPDFRYAAYDSAPVAVAVLAFLVRWWRQEGPSAAAYGVAGMLLSIAGAVLQQSRLGIHPIWFNHNDLYHVVQAVALWLLQRAGLKLRDGG